VTILAVLLILVGIFAVLISLAVLGVGVLLIPDTGGLGVAVGAIALILSFLILAAGFALLSLRPWAWWLAVIVLFLYLSAQAWFVLSGGGIGLLGVVIPALIFIYLLAVRKHFR
jgi:hypothetical protein